MPDDFDGSGGDLWAADVAVGSVDGLSEVVAAGPGGQSVTWSFPVQIELVGELSEDHLRTVATHVFDELDRALRGLG